MRIMMTFATIAMLLVQPTGAFAQPVSLELRSGLSVPTSHPGGTILSSGAGFELSAGIRILPRVGLVGGRNWRHFGNDGSAGPGGYDVSTAGYVLGLLARTPLISGADGWIRAGGLYERIEFENGAGRVIAESDHEAGWEIGAGLSIPFSARFTATPGVRFRSLSAEIDEGEGPNQVDLGYIALEVGLSFSFGQPEQVGIPVP